MKSQRKGSVLILALWVLVFLGVLCVEIGLGLRQRIALLERIERRNDLHNMAEAGIKKAIALLRKSITRIQTNYPAYEKMYTHNNPEMFKDIPIGKGVVSVNYSYPMGESENYEERFGMEDEEGKLNLNATDLLTLRRLISVVITTDQEEADRLSQAIIDWREPGKTQLEGFYSDDYYTNLQFPYLPKDARYEILDELLLVKGVDQRIYERLLPFITIYGDGLINVNTALKEVLLSLGLEQMLVDKILFVRRGPDGIEATVDDHMFQKTFDIPNEIKGVVPLDLGEIKQLDVLNKSGRIKTSSTYYRIHSESRLENRNYKEKVFCIFNLERNKLEYWKEKY